MRTAMIGARRILTVLAAGGFAVAYAVENYIVKEGDTFSEIAQQHVGSPVYPTPAGALIKLRALNPQIKAVELIRPGDVIVLPTPEVAQPVAPVEPTPVAPMPDEVITPEAPVPETVVEEIPEEPFDMYGHVALGFGASFMKFYQTSDLSEPTDFTNLNYPAFSLSGTLHVTAKSRIEASYAVVRGEVPATPTEDGDAFDQTIFLAQRSYLDYVRMFSKRSESSFRSGLRAGAGYARTPFIQALGETGKLKTYTLWSVSLGPSFDWEFGSNWRSELFLRANYPITQDPLFETKAKLFFDGQFGITKSFEKLSWGFFTHIQQQSFTYKYEDADTGKQDIFTSMFETRIGYQF